MVDRRYKRLTVLKRALRTSTEVETGWWDAATIRLAAWEFIVVVLHANLEAMAATSSKLLMSQNLSHEPTNQGASKDTKSDCVRSWAIRC